jgi:hypothetical protein
MKPKIIGTFDMGPQRVQLVLREGDGGEIYLKPGDIDYPRIYVGADKNWEQVMSTLLHEAHELQMLLTGCRLNPAPDHAMDHSSYIFLMNHPQFSEVCARVAMFLVQALPDLAKAYRKWNK